MPFDLASVFMLHHLARRQAARATAAQAPRQQALAMLRASPVHLTLRLPLVHPATAAPVSQPVATDAGVKHPTPQEMANQLVQQGVAQAHALLAQIVAKQQAFLIAHPRPDLHAQPADIAAWLKAGGLSPRALFPEWGWQVVRKTKTPLGAFLGSLLEPGEAIATVQLGPNDGVIWYEHPSGAWSYYHHWGQDLGQVLASVAQTVADTVSKAAAVVGQVVKDVQIAASLIPGVGQIVNEVVTAAEAALDALGGMSGLQIALDTAYHAALAAVPGAEELAPMLDPIMGILKNVAGGQSITKAALGQALQSVPASPSFGSLSPRSVASSLASWLASKVGIAV